MASGVEQYVQYVEIVQQANTTAVQAVTGVKDSSDEVLGKTIRMRVGSVEPA